MSQAGEGVGDPAEPALVRRPGRPHHRRVQPDPGHRGKGDLARTLRARALQVRATQARTTQVRHGQVDYPVPSPEANVDRLAGPGRDPQRPGGQVRGAERHDGQRDPGPGQGLRAGPHGAVPAHREHQRRPGGHRPAGQAQAGVGWARFGEHWFPAGRPRRGPAAAQEPVRVADQRPVDHERHRRHGPLSPASRSGALPDRCARTPSKARRGCHAGVRVAFGCLRVGACDPQAPFYGAGDARTPSGRATGRG